MRGALAAPEQCSQAVVLVPWLPPGTRPWQGSPVMRISCGTSLMPGGEVLLPRDDARTHEPLATGGTPLGMGLPTLGARRLPVQPHRDHLRRLPERRAAQSQRRSPRRMVQPRAPHGPRLGTGAAATASAGESPPRAKLSAFGAAVPSCRVRWRKVTRAIEGHQAGVLDRTATQIAGQIGHDPSRCVP